MKKRRSFFGPSKDEIWSQIATDIDGEYIDGGFWKKDVLIYPSSVSKPRSFRQGYLVLRILNTCCWY